jgi:hypothetical protein
VYLEGKKALDHKPKSLKPKTQTLKQNKMQLRFGLDEEMLAVLEAHWSPKGVLMCVSVCV